MPCACGKAKNPVYGMPGDKIKDARWCSKCAPEGAVHLKHCIHGTMPNRCKDGCGGASLCKEHKRRKETCKECKGSQICEHKRQRSHCVECGGSQICEHKRLRSQCVECGGSRICDHKRLRFQCVECGGSQICDHKRLRSRCVECGGSQICDHKRRRSHCHICSDGRNFCKGTIHNDAYPPPCIGSKRDLCYLCSTGEWRHPKETAS